MSATARTTPLNSAVSPALRSFEAQWRARERDALTNVRDDAMKRVLRLGLPTARDESWRYTNLRRVTAATYVDAPRTLDISQTAANSAAPMALLISPTASACIRLVNGHPILPGSLGSEFESIEIISLRELSRTNPTLIADRIEPLSDADQARWGLLNAALFEDGLYIRVTGQVTAPLVLEHILSARADADAHGHVDVAYPRVIIDAAPGSALTVIEHYVQQGEHAPLCNSATHIAADRHSRVEHYRLFATGATANHVDSLTVRQKSHSYCKQFTMAIGGDLVRCSLEASLDEPEATLDSFALLVGHESRHVDCVNVVTHNARDTQSRQTARAIASGASRVVFNSKVVVNSGAAHADSQQSCRGLLLSTAAEIDARPQLEIHADEVKCAHGATVGRLDPDMLFYMLSRGLDRDTAQSLLIFAFLADTLTGMSVAEARSVIETALIEQLPNSEVLHKFR